MILTSFYVIYLTSITKKSEKSNKLQNPTTKRPTNETNQSRQRTYNNSRVAHTKFSTVYQLKQPTATTTTKKQATRLWSCLLLKMELVNTQCTIHSFTHSFPHTLVVLLFYVQCVIAFYSMLLYSPLQKWCLLYVFGIVWGPVGTQIHEFYFISFIHVVFGCFFFNEIIVKK